MFPSLLLLVLVLLFIFSFTCNTVDAFHLSTTSLSVASSSSRGVFQQSFNSKDTLPRRRRRRQQQQPQRQQQPQHRLYQSSMKNQNDGDKTTTNTEKTSRAQVRFSSSFDTNINKKQQQQQTATVTNPFDAIGTWITSDIGSIVIGTLGLFLLLIGRFILDADSTTTTTTTTDSSMQLVSVEALGQETRVNLLAVFGTGAVLLNGLSKLDVQSVLAEPVELQGIQVNTCILNMNTNNNSNKQQQEDNVNSNIEWAMTAMTKATPADTAILLQHHDNKNNDDSSSSSWNVVAMTGILPSNNVRMATAADPNKEEKNDDLQLSLSLPSSTTPILNRFLTTSTKASKKNSKNRGGETYLPTLQALPGKVELTNSLLPPNTQAALLVPVIDVVGPNNNNNNNNDSSSRSSSGTTMVLVLGSNQARSFTPRDIAWCQTVATRIVV